MVCLDGFLRSLRSVEMTVGGGKKPYSVPREGEKGRGMSERGFVMVECSVLRGVEIVGGGRGDYERLCRYHYREERVGVYAGIFVVRPRMAARVRIGTDVLGVIVYSMPSASMELRNVATGDFFRGFDRKTRLLLVNRNIRCVSRVIIEPRFRGLGLASRLVRETMGRMNVPIIEASAVMGAVNPFFERAGMTAYEGPLPQRCVELLEAFSMVGVERELLIDSRVVQERLDGLPAEKGEFIESQMSRFLGSYGRRRLMGAGIDRTRYILGKLTARPVYYIWFNPGMEVGVD